jgi:hypothetical protein
MMISAPVARRVARGLRVLFALAALLLVVSRLDAADATFLRALNLNGPAVTIDGRAWEADQGAANFSANGKRFANQKVLLKPPTDAARTEMLRSSVWGGTVSVEFTGLAKGAYQVVLYVWEDNHTEQFDLLVNGKVVIPSFYSGDAGMWRRLGPWRAEVTDGKLTVGAKGASHGAANLSGIELWSGDGEVPDLSRPQFTKNPTPEQLTFFENKIRPVLFESCYECHSATATKIKGGLVLDSRAGVQKGGDTGPAVTPGDPDASLLIQALRHATEDLAMPPKKKLPPQVIADFEQWVKMGAPDPRDTDTLAAVKAKDAIDWNKAREWWSFRPLTAPKVPAVKNAKWALNDIDRFILAKQEAANLKPASDAQARALIRRMTYDLTGLPPAPEEVEAFVRECTDGDAPASSERGRRRPRGSEGAKDKANARTKPSALLASSLSTPQAQLAIERLVERLLASPRYGERWGRHWLDVVRYADTAGDNSDYPVPQMHRYRDWVIDAFNRDQPYDEFVRDQIAGDLRGGATDDERYQRIIATGYIANSRRFGSRVDDYPQHLTIEDTIDNLGRSFLGITVSCARCHDHKFDPVSQRDYYGLYGIFHSTRYPWPGIELDKKPREFVPLVPPDKLAEAEAAQRELEKERSRLNSEVAKLKNAIKDEKGDKKEELQAQLKDAEAAYAKVQKKSLPFEMAYAVAEAKRIEDVPVQQKGDPAKPGDMVPRKFLTVMGGPELAPDIKSSGRAQLADWILADNNPLTARVMVNRIWQQHFGRGLVATPNDFGKQGKPPTHPELLDYLAVKFRDGGWSVKAMHRLILLSRTYQQAAVRDADALARDPSNEMLAGFPRRRLDAESIRDTLLAVGGNLDLSPAGAHPFPPAHEWGYTQHKPFKDVYPSNRRSVYLMTQRIQRHPYLAIFDGADPSASTPARTTSTTPLQALWLLNDPLVHEQSKLVADRLIAHATDDTARVQHAYELVFARPAAPEEITAAATFLASAKQQLCGDNLDTAEVEPEAWRAYVRALFRLNEFVYVE